jgi:methyltransferase (TIGR00027 family)
MKEGESSSTALLIAKSLVFAQGDPRLAALIPKRSADLVWHLLRGTIGWQASLFRTAGRLGLAQAAVRQIERISVPGMSLHYILRKRQIEAWVEAHVQQGLVQLVVLGAGFDTLGLRMAEAYAGLRVYEVDHPATQASKQRALQRETIATPPNFRFIAADLSTQDSVQVLTAMPHFSFTAPTVFVAEGVLMYVPLQEVWKLLGVLQRFNGTKASFIFSYMTPNEQGTPGFAQQGWLVDRWLAARSEPFAWGLPPVQIVSEAQHKGFRIKQQADATALRAGLDGLGYPQSAVGENLIEVSAFPAHGLSRILL